MEYLHKVVVLGDIGCGKTSFVKKAVHGIFSMHYKSTVGVDFALWNLKDGDDTHRLQLWDLAGQERFGNMTRVYFKETHGCIIMCDCTRPSTIDAVQKWLNDFNCKHEKSDFEPPCYLIFNKVDLSNDDSTEEMENAVAKFENTFSKVFCISCKDSDKGSLDKILLQLSKDIIEKSAIAKQKIIEEDQKIIEENESRRSAHKSKSVDELQPETLNIHRQLEGSIKSGTTDLDLTNSQAYLKADDMRKLRAFMSDSQLPGIINHILAAIVKNPCATHYDYVYEDKYNDQVRLVIRDHFEGLGYECESAANLLRIKW